MLNIWSGARMNIRFPTRLPYASEGPVLCISECIGGWRRCESQGRCREEEREVQVEKNTHTEQVMSEWELPVSSFFVLAAAGEGEATRGLGCELDDGVEGEEWVGDRS
jgi:hypothetical protein